MKKILLFVLTFIVAATWFGLCPDHAVNAQGTQQSLEGVNLIDITGKVTKESDGYYYIQGQNPTEIFRILNPIPTKLSKIVKYRMLVKIEASVVLGDNIDIEKINGIPY